MVTKYKAHRLKCDWCGRLFWSDERFVVTGNKIVLEYKCNEQFVKKIEINKCPVIRISDGKKVRGSYNPSTDTPTHQEIYKRFSQIKSKR